jgi:hypothetical protein
MINVDDEGHSYLGNEKARTRRACMELKRILSLSLRKFNNNRPLATRANPLEKSGRRQALDLATNTPVPRGGDSVQIDVFVAAFLNSLGL